MCNTWECASPSQGYRAASNIPVGYKGWNGKELCSTLFQIEAWAIFDLDEPVEVSIDDQHLVHHGLKNTQ
jgi:hypothetical protein